MKTGANCDLQLLIITAPCPPPHPLKNQWWEQQPLTLSPCKKNKIMKRLKYFYFWDEVLTRQWVHPPLPPRLGHIGIESGWWKMTSCSNDSPCPFISTWYSNPPRSLTRGQRSGSVTEQHPPGTEDTWAAGRGFESTCVQLPSCPTCSWSFAADLGEKKNWCGSILARCHFKYSCLIHFILIITRSHYCRAARVVAWQPNIDPLAVSSHADLWGEEPALCQCVPNPSDLV